MQARKTVVARPLAALLLATGLAAGMLAPVSAVAQQAPAEAADFSQQSIEAFVEAALRVAEIRDDYTAALQTADSEAEQDRLIHEGNSAMLAAVEETPNITVEEYITIGEAAAVDPELGQRIAMLIEQAGGSLD